MLDVNHVSFRYRQAAADTLHDLHFQVAAGEIFGFLGPSGAGKSTTQKILIRLAHQYRGTVTVNGRDLRAWGQDYYRLIGVSFEAPNHYLRLTARENLDYFASLYGGATEAPDTLLEEVGLADAAAMPVAQFSKGMKNRLNLARSLLHRPQLLFLDEPTSGLDPVSAARIKQVIAARRAAGTTVFLTTHSMTLADELCDRVALLVDGRIAALDQPAALRRRYGTRRLAVTARTAGGLQEFAFPLDGLGDNAAFQQLLREATIETMHSCESTLEQVFLQITGKGLA
jgi:fluoroquinolone transport system ATP-binding protein